jgi:hypothetical protein
MTATALTVVASIPLLKFQSLEKEMPMRQKSRFKSAAQFLAEKMVQALIQEMLRAVLRDWLE